MPGIFACGDVRQGPVKRVAAAVGEGSMAIAFVHQYLREAGRRGGYSTLTFIRISGAWTVQTILYVPRRVSFFE